jgi:hypothetical protein
MMSRLRSGLSYANVVATLALFVALGGSAYAVSQIGSKQVKNRSLKGIDLRRNTLTGKEVRESKLGLVPHASAADNAHQADAALSAGVATDAQQLGGQAPAFFEKSSRTQFRRTTGTPSQGQVLDWPVLSLRIEAPQQGGCADPDHVTLRIVNDRTSGPDLQVFRTNGGDTASVPPGVSVTTCSGEDGRWDGAAAYPDDGRTLFFDCRRLGTEVRCLGERSEP